MGGEGSEEREKGGREECKKEGKVRATAVEREG
jgi:hypothetical protein